MNAERKRVRFNKLEDPTTRTCRRCEEVEKRIVLDLLGDSSLGTATFVTLRFLDSLHRHVLSLYPINRTSTNETYHFLSSSEWKNMKYVCSAFNRHRIKIEFYYPK